MVHAENESFDLGELQKKHYHKSNYQKMSVEHIYAVFNK